MSLLETVRDGSRRYYLDGRRIGAERARDLKTTHRMDSMSTAIDGPLTRHWCSLRAA